MKNESYFSTHDLNLTATITALGHTLVSIQKDPGGRAQFSFKQSEKLKQDISAYWQQDSTINAHKLFYSLKYVKSRLYHSTPG